jgi:hypothetical protein
VSQLGRTRIYPNTPIVFDIEVLECEKDFKKLLSIGRTFQTHVEGSRVVGSGLKPFEGNNLYNKDGSVKRSGGGTPKDASEVVEVYGKRLKKNLQIVQKAVENHKKKATKYAAEANKLREKAKKSNLTKSESTQLVKAENSATKYK